MATKKSMFVLFGILSISVWILGSAIQAGAETLNYKVYSYVTKGERVPIGDVEEHTMGFQTRKAFCVFENGEVATQSMVLTNDLIKGSGSSLQYSTLTFADGSTIIMKVQVTVETVAGSSAAKMTREIIKGTGRFEGIKGTGTTNIKYLPVEKDEAGAKGYGEGTITYTLPSK
jgi:hypothetical protein